MVSVILHGLRFSLHRHAGRTYVYSKEALWHQTSSCPCSASYYRESQRVGGGQLKVTIKGNGHNFVITAQCHVWLVCLSLACLGWELHNVLYIHHEIIGSKKCKIDTCMIIVGMCTHWSMVCTGCYDIFMVAYYVTSAVQWDDRYLINVWELSLILLAEHRGLRMICTKQIKWQATLH